MSTKPMPGGVISKSPAKIACTEPCASFRPVSDIPNHKEAQPQTAYSLGQPQPHTATAIAFRQGSINFLKDAFDFLEDSTVFF